MYIIYFTIINYYTRRTKINENRENMNGEGDDFSHINIHYGSSS